MSQTSEGGQGRDRLGLPTAHRSQVVVAVVAVVVLALVAFGVIAYVQGLTSLTAATPSPTPTPKPLALPVQIGELSRDPAVKVQASTDPMSKAQLLSAKYAKGGKDTLIAVAARPIESSERLLNQLGVVDPFSVGDGRCGRTRDQLNACAVGRGTTAVLAIALAGQQPAELIAQAQQILGAVTA